MILPYPTRILVYSTITHTHTHIPQHSPRAVARFSGIAYLRSVYFSVLLILHMLFVYFLQQRKLYDIRLIFRDSLRETVGITLPPAHRVIHTRVTSDQNSEHDKAHSPLRIR